MKHFSQYCWKDIGIGRTKFTCINSALPLASKRKCHQLNMLGDKNNNIIAVAAMTRINNNQTGEPKVRQIVLKHLAESGWILLDLCAFISRYCSYLSFLRIALGKRVGPNMCVGELRLEAGVV